MDDENNVVDPLMGGETGAGGRGDLNYDKLIKSKGSKSKRSQSKSGKNQKGNKGQANSSAIMDLSLIATDGES